MNSIPISQIANVNTAVLTAGGSNVSIYTMVISNSTRIPIGTFQNFSEAPSVSDYFGPASTQYAFAQVYFAGFDGSHIKPAILQFAQYPQTAVAAYLRGGDISALALTSLQALTGNLAVTIDGYEFTSATINLSSANSFSAAAALINTGIAASPPLECSFTGSISGTTLTVTDTTSGLISPGLTISGTNVTSGTKILSQLSGTAFGIGTYSVSISQTVSSETISGHATAPSVVYDSISGAFVITSGNTGEISTVSYATGTLASSLYLTSATGAVTSQGSDAQTPSAFMSDLILKNGSFSAFTTDYDPDGGSGNTVKLEFAAWNTLQGNNYLYICKDTDITPTESTDASSSMGQILIGDGNSGTALIYEQSLSDPHYIDAFLAGAIASVDYTQLNGKATMAFKSQPGLSATVTSGAVSTNLIANGYNFYGNYKDSAENTSYLFLYPGSVTGDYAWIDAYVDQIWLRRKILSALISFLTSTRAVPYNNSGRSALMAALTQPMQDALYCGVAQKGIDLSTTQINSINLAVGNSNAASSLVSNGYIILIEPFTAAMRAARTSPNITIWYGAGGSMQKLSVQSIEVQ